MKTSKQQFGNSPRNENCNHLIDLKTLWQKENIAHYEQFLLLPQCFIKSCLLQRHQKASTVGKGCVHPFLSIYSARGDMFRHKINAADDFENIVAKCETLTIRVIPHFASIISIIVTFIYKDYSYFFQDDFKVVC